MRQGKERRERASGGIWGGGSRRVSNTITHQVSISCTTQYISHECVAIVIHLHEKKVM